MPTISPTRICQMRFSAARKRRREEVCTVCSVMMRGLCEVSERGACAGRKDTQFAHAAAAHVRMVRFWSTVRAGALTGGSLRRRRQPSSWGFIQAHLSVSRSSQEPRIFRATSKGGNSANLVHQERTYELGRNNPTSFGGMTVGRSLRIFVSTILFASIDVFSSAEEIQSLHHNESASPETNLQIFSS